MKFDLGYYLFMVSRTAVSAPTKDQDIFGVEHEFAVLQASIHEASRAITEHKWFGVD